MSEFPSLYQVYAVPRVGEKFPLSEPICWAMAYDLVRHLYRDGCPCVLSVLEVLF